jgi:hypothetical protein
VLTNTEKKAKKEKFKKNVKAQVIKTQLKPLTQAMLMAELKGVLSTLPDKRTRTPQHSMLNVGLAAFSVFFMQLPSFLAQQTLMLESRGECNAFSIFGLSEIPSDNQIRNLLDPVSPCMLNPLFNTMFDLLLQRGVLEEFRSVNDMLLFALDGLHYFSSSKIECDCCQKQKHSNGTTTCSHAAVAVAVVSPQSPEVLSLAPEFITPQEHYSKQDCEIEAAKRWLAQHAKRYASLGVALLGDDLYAHQPFCEAVLSEGMHFIFTCKPDSHKTLYEWVDSFSSSSADVPFIQVRRKGKQKLTDTYRFHNQVPLRDSKDALLVNWCELITTDEKGTTLYRNAFITDVLISVNNVADIVSAARSRWCIENEHNNVLKNRGYNLTHNFGHGKEYLSQTLFTLNLLAFLFHTVLELQCEDYQLLRETIGTRERFFHGLQILTEYIYFPSWEKLIAFMLQGLKEKHRLVSPS